MAENFEDYKDCNPVYDCNTKATVHREQFKKWKIITFLKRYRMKIYYSSIFFCVVALKALKFLVFKWHRIFYFDYNIQSKREL